MYAYVGTFLFPCEKTRKREKNDCPSLVSRKRKEFSRIRGDITRDKDTSNRSAILAQILGNIFWLGFHSRSPGNIPRNYASTAAKQEKLLDGDHAYRSSLNHACLTVVTSGIICLLDKKKFRVSINGEKSQSRIYIILCLVEEYLQAEYFILFSSFFFVNFIHEDFVETETLLYIYSKILKNDRCIVKIYIPSILKFVI